MDLVLPDGERGFQDMAKQKAISEAMVGQFIEMTAMSIYAYEVVSQQVNNVVDLRKAAEKAKNAAPFLAEALGKIQINIGGNGEVS